MNREKNLMSLIEAQVFEIKHLVEAGVTNYSEDRGKSVVRLENKIRDARNMLTELRKEVTKDLFRH